MDYGHEWTDKELKKLERRISREYKQAAKEVQGKLDDYLKKFVEQDNAKKAELAAGKITEKEYKQWCENKIATGQRWAQLKAELSEDFHNANKITASMTRQFSYDAYAMNYNFGTYEVEKGTHIDTSFTLYDRSTVERLVRDNPQMLPPPGKRTAKRIQEGKDKLWNQQQIQSVMLQSILQGEPIPKIADRLADAVGDSNRAAAIRNARTMTTGAENAGRVDSYKRAEKMGIKMEQMWVATLDDRTRYEHRQLDGMRVVVGEPFEIDGYTIRFPGDPQAEPEMVYNCRCTLIAAVAGTEIDQNEAKDLPRNSKLGDMTYEEWKYAKDKEPKSETKKQIKFVEVHNKQEAKAELEKIFGSVESNFMKNDERLIVENTNQLLKLNARFNAITENNTGYLTASPSGKAMGYASSRFIPDPSGKLVERTNLGLVGKYYKDYDTVIKTEEMCIEEFWNMPTLKENLSVYTVTHEYGHILENMILVKRTDYNELQKKIDGMTRPSAQQMQSVYQKAKKNGAKDIYNEIVAIAKEKNPDFKIKDNLSEYGHTNHFEAFAEIFANSQCGEPNELGLAMQEWLKKEEF